MNARSQVLAESLALVARAKKKRPRLRAADATWQLPVADLVAAGMAAGMTQEQIAARMWTTKSTISPLESGVRTLPTLGTIERYALAVGARVEIRVRSFFPK